MAHQPLIKTMVVTLGLLETVKARALGRPLWRTREAREQTGMVGFQEALRGAGVWRVLAARG